jgi:hypothetical protein
LAQAIKQRLASGACTQLLKTAGLSISAGIEIVVQGKLSQKLGVSLQNKDTFRVMGYNWSTAGWLQKQSGVKGGQNDFIKHFIKSVFLDSHLISQKDFAFLAKTLLDQSAVTLNFTAWEDDAPLDISFNHPQICESIIQHLYLQGPHPLRDCDRSKSAILELKMIKGNYKIR